MLSTTQCALATTLSLFCIIPHLYCNPIQNPALSGYTGLGGGGGSNSVSFATQATTTDTDFDPEDFSAIKTFVTLGDSYAAGIGAGVRTDYKCSRYDHAYPALLSTYQGLENATFQFLACSGATSVDMLGNQVPAITGTADAMTVSAGGNDVGLVDILNNCIFGWKIVGYSSSSCDSTLTHTQSLIDNELPGALDKLLAALVPKITPTTGRIYYTAYAQFFGSSTQCENVYWNFWPLDPFKQALTAARRTQMNTLTTNVNNAIQAAVKRAGPQVVFVDYDPYYTDFDGRFCEADVTEPDADRDELLFFQRATTNPALNWRRKRSGGIGTIGGPSIYSSADEAAQEVPDNIVANGTFEGSVASMLSTTLATNPAWINALNDSVFQMLEVGDAPADGGAPHIISAVSPSANVTSAKMLRHRGIGDFAAWLIADSVKRVFHPRPQGHSLMASLVIYHMEAENAMMHPAPEYATNASTVWTEVGPALSCPLQAPDIPIAQIAQSNGSVSSTAGLPPTLIPSSSIAPPLTSLPSPISTPAPNLIAGTASLIQIGPNGPYAGITIPNAIPSPVSSASNPETTLTSTVQYIQPPIINRRIPDTGEAGKHLK